MTQTQPFKRIEEDLKKALKDGNKTRVETLRFLVAAIKRFKIDTYPPSSNKSLTSDDVVKIIQKQIKQRNESINAYEKGGRAELAKKETDEKQILEEYAPKQLSDEELTQIVSVVMNEKNTNFGAVMGEVMKRVKGKADGGRVSKIVKEKLQG